MYMAAYPADGAALNILYDANSNAKWVDVYINTLAQLSIRPKPAIKGRLDWAIRPVQAASADLSTALPDGPGRPGLTDGVFQCTTAGTVAAVAMLSTRKSLRSIPIPHCASARSRSPETDKGSVR